MNLVAYVRVSSQTQVDEGLGLEIQREAIAEWAQRHGHVIIAYFADEGVSGTKEATERPGLASALVAVEDAAEGLVVYKLDRLARTLSVQEAVLGQVWKMGGVVFGLDVGEVLQDDPDDPMRTAMRQMVGVFGQLERAMITARMRAGRRAKAARGGYAGGAPRFGRRAEDKELVVEPEEQETLARIVELRREGRSLRQIGAALSAEGRRPRRADTWHPKVLSGILARIGDAA